MSRVLSSTLRRAWGAMAFALLVGCRPPPTLPPPTSNPASATDPAPVVNATPKVDSADSIGVLRDWVARPLIDPSETEPTELRIVSAAPNVTEICCALGLSENLVGRTRYCTYPPGIDAVPDIGALIDVNVERLLALRPDVVIVSGTSRSHMERFARLDLRFEAIPDKTLDDLFAGIRRVGDICRRPRTAEQLCENIRADLARVTARLGNGADLRVLLLIGTLSDPPRPPFIAGPDSFYDHLLRRSGRENAAPPATGAFGPLSLEYIVRADPEVIIELDADGTARPGGDADAKLVWGKVGDLSAVANNRVRVLRGAAHFLLGPRIASTYAAICAACLDPGE